MTVCSCEQDPSTIFPHSNKSSIPFHRRKHLQNAYRPMRHALSLATLFSAFVLLRHVHLHLYVYRPTILSTFPTVRQTYPQHFPSPPTQLTNTTARTPFSTISEQQPQPSQNSTTHTISPKLVHRDHGFNHPSDFSTFDNATLLNYFHMHKTGGVSFKNRLYEFFSHCDDNIKPLVFDTCHISKTTRAELGIEQEWSCDWTQLAALAKPQRHKIDVIIGHQYWMNGAGYLVPNRDIRYFTVMRHPLHRKISFFYHFFVRNTGREEHDVTIDELVEFVLGTNMPDSPIVRDAGPGYYASRLWSDGWTGYNHFHKFEISESMVGRMVDNSIKKLRNNFVFIGLQTQEAASLCMLKKTVAAFVKARGWHITRFEQFEGKRQRMNTGNYPLSANVLWQRMTDLQRSEFLKVENVDLAIYRECVNMFHEMVKRFGCDHLVVGDVEHDISLSLRG